MKFDIFPPNSSNPFDSEKKLRVKFGIDPTAPRLHLGHLVPLRLVKAFQDKGHDIRLILGTFTATLGDPSGRDKTRPILDVRECQHNANQIMGIVSRVLGAEQKFWLNGTWFSQWSAIQLLKFVGKFNIEELLSRDAFQRRMENNASIATHEVIVPLLQGWDSVQVAANVEIGGNDQLFNFQMSRRVQLIEGQAPETCLLTPIINGTDGRKMSKSFDNCIFLDENPSEIFGKVMSISDEVMEQWIPLFSENTPPSEHPMEKKKWLSWEITKQIWDCKAADSAQMNFQRTVQSQEKPTDISNIESCTVVQCVVLVRGCSKSDAMRLIKQGGVKINDEKIDLTSVDKPLVAGDLIQVGRRDFRRII